MTDRADQGIAQTFRLGANLGLPDGNRHAAGNGRDGNKQHDVDDLGGTVHTKIVIRGIKEERGGSNTRNRREHCRNGAPTQRRHDDRDQEDDGYVLDRKPHECRGQRGGEYRNDEKRDDDAGELLL